MQGVIGSSPIPSTKNRNESCGSFLLFGIFFDPLKAAAFGGSKYLVAVRRDIAQDLLHIAMQDPAKVIQCGCVQIVIPNVAYAYCVGQGDTVKSTKTVGKEFLQ